MKPLDTTHTITFMYLVTFRKLGHSELDHSKP